MCQIHLHWRVFGNVSMDFGRNWASGAQVSFEFSEVHICRHESHWKSLEEFRDWSNLLTSTNVTIGIISMKSDQWNIPLILSSMTHQTICEPCWNVRTSSWSMLECQTIKFGLALMRRQGLQFNAKLARSKSWMMHARIPVIMLETLCTSLKEAWNVLGTLLLRSNMFLSVGTLGWVPIGASANMSKIS